MAQVRLNGYGQPPPLHAQEILDKLTANRNTVLRNYCTSSQFIIGGVRWAARFVYWLPNKVKLAEFDFSARDCA